MSTGFLIGIIGGGVLLVGLLIGGVVFALNSTSGSGDQQAGANFAPGNFAPGEGNPNFAGGNPNPVGGNNPAVENPAPVVDNTPIPADKKEEPKAVPTDLDPDALRRVKGSTVYLRVALPGGGVAEGTGFFALERGVIVTNAHVLGMLTADSVAPKSVTVKVNHGEPNEIELNGLVLGVDRTNDLAVLRADSTGAPLPAPLLISPTAKLIETQKVWVFGFPLGVRLGKNVTVSTSSVSSLRKDATGAITQVQVNGGMQPGNSGGPVVNGRGDVVGVAVSIIQGTQINFAIPGDFVTRVLAGNVSGQDFGTPFAGDGGRATVPVRLKTLDPLGRIREVKLEVWSGPAGEAPPATAQTPRPKPGDGPRQRVVATAKDGKFTADVPLPALPAGQVYWSQPVVVDAAGATSWAAARAIPFDPKTVIDRRAALLQIKPPTGPIERTLHVASNKTIKIFGLDEPLAFSEKMDGYLLESSAPDAMNAGTRSSLRLHKPRFTRESGGKVSEAPPTIGAIVGRLSPSYLISPTNSVSNFIRPGLNTVPSTLQESIGDLFDTVCNAYEVTTVPLPNRMVQPQETWTARVPMLISTGPPRQQVRVVGKRRIVRPVPKKEVRALNLTCTFEGTRTANGVQQGYVLLTGVVNGNGAKAKEVYGKVSGHALVDLNSGMLSQVKTTISLEMESESSGARLLLTNENVVDRVEGNTQGIKIPPPAPPVAKQDTPTGWKRSVAKDRSFSVSTPDSAGPAKAETQASPPKKGSPLRLNFVKILAKGKDGPLYAASAITVFPSNLIARNTPAGRIDWFRDLVRDRNRVSGEKSITLGRVPGKEFLLESPAGVSRYRVFSHLDKFYAAVVTGTKEQVESKEATTFLDSLTLPVPITGPMATGE